MIRPIINDIKKELRGVRLRVTWVISEKIVLPLAQVTKFYLYLSAYIFGQIWIHNFHSRPQYLPALSVANYTLWIFLFGVLELFAGIIAFYPSRKSWWLVLGIATYPVIGFLIYLLSPILLRFELVSLVLSLGLAAWWGMTIYATPLLFVTITITSLEIVLLRDERIKTRYRTLSTS